MKNLDVSTKTFPGKICLIDDDDYEWAKYFKWSALLSRNTFYVVRSERNPNGTRRTVRIHRDIVRAMSHEDVDHINGDGLDNRKENLRLCNSMQNQQNRIKRKTAKSGSPYKGTFYRRNRKGEKCRCFAYITINRKRYQLGTYDTPEEAAKEYDSKALYYFKERARLNFSANDTVPSPILGVGKL